MKVASESGDKMGNIDDVIKPLIIDGNHSIDGQIIYESSAWYKNNPNLYPACKITDTEILVHRPDLGIGIYQTFMTKEMFIEAFNKWIMEVE